MIEELQRNICLVGINDLDARLFLECIERVTEDKANKKLKKRNTRFQSLYSSSSLHWIILHSNCSFLYNGVYWVVLKHISYLSQDSSVGSISTWYGGGPGLKTQQGREFLNENNYFALKLFVFVQWSILGVLKLPICDVIVIKKVPMEIKLHFFGWDYILLALFAQKYILGKDAF